MPAAARASASEPTAIIWLSRMAIASASEKSASTVRMVPPVKTDAVDCWTGLPHDARVKAPNVAMLPLSTSLRETMPGAIGSAEAGFDEANS